MYRTNTALRIAAFTTVGFIAIMAVLAPFLVLAIILMQAVAP